MHHFSSSIRTFFALALFVVAGCAGGPAANDDAAATRLNEAVEIDVLANDDEAFADDLAITVQPPNGEAVLTEDGAIRYTPAYNFVGDDTFRYSIGEGGDAEAEVAISVECATCMVGDQVTLRWTDPNPPGEVDGFRLYMAYEAAVSGDDLRMVDDVVVEHAGYDPTEIQEATYDAWHDMYLHHGDTGCFRMTAYNEDGESTYSNEVCRFLEREVGGKADIVVDL